MSSTQVAERLRDADTVARLGGDEFAVLLAGHQTTDASQHVADELRQAFAAPSDLPSGLRHVGVSIGAAPLDGSGSFEDALHVADIAMYAYKQSQSTRFIGGDPLAELHQRA